VLPKPIPQEENGVGAIAEPQMAEAEPTEAQRHVSPTMHKEVVSSQEGRIIYRLGNPKDLFQPDLLRAVEGLEGRVIEYYERRGTFIGRGWNLQYTDAAFHMVALLRELVDHPQVCARRSIDDPLMHFLILATGLGHVDKLAEIFPERAQVLRRYLGTDDSFTVIAEDMGLTRQRVSQIWEAALKFLWERMPTAGGRLPDEAELVMPFDKTTDFAFDALKELGYRRQGLGSRRNWEQNRESMLMAMQGRPRPR
jgi:hypothetical protein